MFKAKDKAHNNTLYSLLVLEPLVPFNPVLAKQTTLSTEWHGWGTPRIFLVVPVKYRYAKYLVYPPKIFVNEMSK